MASPANKWQHSYIRHWILPAALLAGILLFDLFFLPRATITPVSSFLILVLLAFILPPVPMIFWAVIYAITTLVVIFNPDIFRPGTPDVALIHGIRSVGAVFGASVAVLLCFHRLKVGRQSEQLNLLVKEIRVPFVLSDANGEIILMNKQAAGILGVSGRRVVGDSYFSLLTDANNKGDSIQRYVELFDTKSPGETIIELKPQNNPGVVLQGTLIPADGAETRYLITIISEPALV